MVETTILLKLITNSYVTGARGTNQIKDYKVVGYDLKSDMIGSALSDKDRQCDRIGRSHKNLDRCFTTFLLKGSFRIMIASVTKSHLINSIYQVE